MFCQDSVVLAGDMDYSAFLSSKLILKTSTDTHNLTSVLSDANILHVSQVRRHIRCTKRSEDCPLMKKKTRQQYNTAKSPAPLCHLHHEDEPERTARLLS